MAKLTLKKPITYDGVEYTSLEYDFDTLTGDDILSAEAEMDANGISSPAPMVTGTYQAALFARAAKVDYHMMIKLGAQDFVAATIAVKSFLNDSV